MAELLARPKICGGCEKPGCDLKCACKLKFYCGKECQQADWPNHKEYCRIALANEVEKAKSERSKDDVMYALMTAGNGHFHQGRFPEAEQCFLKARRILAKQHRERHYEFGVTSSMLGSLYSEMGRHGEAMAMYQEGLEI